MPLTEVVVDRLHHERRFLHESLQIFGMVHLAVTIGYGGEIHTCESEAEGCRLKSLAVPKGFHNVEATVGIHSFCSTAEDAHYLLL